jgi:ribose 5-phosphate isomerase B
MKIYLGADHKGITLKEKIKSYLEDQKVNLEDCGAYILDKDDDYPLYATRVAKKVIENKNNLGILICGSGVGVDVVANKFDGIRASLGKSADQIRSGRNDDNMNVLVIAADFTEGGEAKDLVKAFLDSKFEKADRHLRRLSEIAKIEANN